MSSISRHFVTLDVFTQTKYAGNPLAVVELQDGDDDISTERLQLIAREFNYSETVFLYRRQDELDGATRQWKIRIFLTDAEVPFAGHPVIGTAFHVKSRILPEDFTGMLRLACPAGDVDFDLAADDAFVHAQVPHNYRLHTAAVNSDAILQLQPALSQQQIKGSRTASPVKGMNFMLTELQDLDALASTSANGKKAAAELDEGWAHGFLGTAWYVYTGKVNGIRQYRTRMIEQSLEDPATGSMSCGLASYLALAAKTKQQKFQFTQGVEMGRQSEIFVDVVLNDSADAIVTLTLTGTAVHIMKGLLEL